MVTYGNDKTYKLYFLSTNEKPELGEESNGSVLLEIYTGKNICIMVLKKNNF